MQAMGNSCKYRGSFARWPATHLLLCSPVPNRPRTSTGLEVRPRHSYFLKAPLVIGMQPGLRSIDQKKNCRLKKKSGKRESFSMYYIKLKSSKEKGDKFSSEQLLFNGYGVSVW